MDEQRELIIRDVLDHFPGDMKMRILLPEDANADPPVAKIRWEGSARDVPYTLAEEEAGDMFLSVVDNEPVLNIVLIVYSLVE